MERLKYLAFAAAYRRVGAIVLQGSDVAYWKLSTKAAKDAAYAQKFAQKLIDQWNPDVVVSERSDLARYKGARTKGIIDTIHQIAEDNPMLSIAIERRHMFKNKYEEAADLAARYPRVAHLEPKPRRLFEREPRSTVVFEALSLAESVRRGPTSRLAAAMG